MMKIEIHIYNDAVVVRDYTKPYVPNKVKFQNYTEESRREIVGAMLGWKKEIETKDEYKHIKIEIEVFHYDYFPKDIKRLSKYKS